jgi:hypothetical protein
LPGYGLKKWMTYWVCPNSGLKYQIFRLPGVLLPITYRFKGIGARGNMVPGLETTSLIPVPIA